MSDNLMDKFQSAIAAIEARIEKAESNPDIQSLESIREERKNDLREINELRNEIEQIKKRIQDV